MADKTITPRDLGIPTEVPMPKRGDWRIGMVGFGGIARGAHLMAYRSAGWKVVAVADPAPAAREAAKAAGIERVYENAEDLAADPEVEVISLLTQPTVREAVVAAAARAGKPLQTEKPLGLDLVECERMVEIAERAGIAFDVNQNYRYMPGNFVAHHIVQKGLIGEPYYAAIEVQGRQDAFLGNHDYYAKCTDFLTVQWNTHLADLLRYWTGRDPRRVFARGGRMKGQNFVSDNLLISIADFGDGLTGHVVHSELLRSGLTRAACRVDGHRGSVTFEWGGANMLISSEALGPDTYAVDMSGIKFPFAFAGPMADVLISIEERREPLVSARRNLATIRQVLAEQESVLAGGKWISL